MNITKYCIEIAQLLESVGEEKWINQFTYFITQSQVSENVDLCKQILSIYKGIGSFNDLVLYKNGKLCYYENETLDLLREKLYTEAIRYL